MNYKELKEKQTKIRNRIKELEVKNNAIRDTLIEDLNLSNDDIKEIINLMDTEGPREIDGAKIEDVSFEYKDGKFVFYMDYEKSGCERGHLHDVKDGVFVIETFGDLQDFKDNPEKQLEYQLGGFIDEDECDYCQEENEGEG